jgi:hypothetical protein
MLVYFRAIWYILWSFGIFYGIFFPFWYVEPRKLWQPWFNPYQYTNGMLTWYIHNVANEKWAFSYTNAKQTEMNLNIILKILNRDAFNTTIINTIYY